MTAAMPAGRTISVEELRDAHWIRIRTRVLDDDAAQAVRTACLRALERNVSHLVVDLTGVEEVSPDGLDILEAAADELLAKRGTLWLANNSDAELEFQIRPVPADGLGELRDLSAALDAALSTDQMSRPAS